LILSHIKASILMKSKKSKIVPFITLINANLWDLLNSAKNTKELKPSQTVQAYYIQKI
jgi:hypothetical protein